MAHRSRAARIASVAALDDTTTRAVFDFVSTAAGPVARDAAAEALGVSRRIAAAHLDKLADQGLLSVEFRRLHDRTGPGAGRPAKLYRRTADEVVVSVPDRRYDLAANLLAAAVTEAIDSGAGVEEIVHRTAYEAGREITANSPDLLSALTGTGFEPHGTDTGLVLANCPFHRLARQYTDLVCGLNLHLLRGMTDGAGAPYRPALDPAPDRCCVRLLHDSNR
ncbi:helix-turn-helix transcriptional regulator [Actinoplanes sp. GCM10030250]|uniref:helix-turn-helix transcriptional regulator n=1 Tax=Actinoplanes sp. GCM10030250 TaxID=3273376 RepID=UPI0036161CCE